MTTFVTENDQSREEQIFKQIKFYIPALKDLTFKHQTGTSIFDYHGYKDNKLVCKVDVKVRDYSADDFEDYFVGRDKVQEMRAKPTLAFYMVFFFTKDRRVRVYNLRDCNLEEKDIGFTHKRSGEYIEKRIFVLWRGCFIFEAFLL